MRLHTAAACVAALFLASSVFGHTVSLRLLLLAAAIVLTTIVVARQKDVRSLPPIWLPFALWGAWALLSLTWSVDPGFSLKEWRNEVFYTGAAVWVCYIGAQARNAARIFGSIMALAAVLACTIALAEFSVGYGEYLSGWHGGPGDHSSALLVLMPCAAVAAWYASRARWPWPASLCLWALVALLFASGYTTLNRTLWLAFAVEFAVLGALLLQRSPGMLRSTRNKVLIAVIAAAAITGGSAILIQTQSQRQERSAATSPGQDHRLVLWPEIVHHISAKPLTGHGFGRGVMREALQQKFAKFDGNLWHAHNLLLEALLQVGVLGLLLLMSLLVATARAGWQASRASPEATAACGMALLGILAGMLMRNMTDSLLVRQNSLLFWGATGVLLAWCSKPWRA